MIIIKNLNKYFNKGKKNELHVLNGINVEFEDRGLVCILGESGSGKTTLLNTIGGLDTFADGEMNVDGTVLRKYSPKEIEKMRNDKFGYIFQNYYLLQDYTVGYNVKLALNTFEISEEEKDERVSYVLEKLGMLKYKKKLVSQLSGGQQQRVSIARALVKAPKIILADEPTGNLDEENTLRTMSILKNISKECLVILVSHERRIAEFFADRIIEIRDGKIQSDYRNRNQDAYERMDDGNIYLKDLECVEISSRENAKVNVYQAPEEETGTILLNLAWKNGKLYIQNLADCDVLLAGQEIGCEMIDDYKPNLDMENVEEFDFNLPHLQNQKKAKLSQKEIWKMAIENITLMGKKQAFIIGILLIMAVMLTVVLANFTNSFFFNKREVVKSDSHYVSVRVSPADAINDIEYNEAFEAFCKKYAFKGKYSDIFRSNGGNLTLKYDGFAQLSSFGVNFEDFSYVSIEHVQKKDLIYGRMPKTNKEIVVDRWLFDRFFETDSPYKILLTDVEAFLGLKLLSSVTGDEFKIVGIADTNEPSIYIEQNRALGLSVNAYRVASIGQLQAEFPGEYDDITLEENEALVTESAMVDFDRRKNESFTLKNGREYKIAGAFSDDMDVDYIMSEEACQQIRNDYILSTKGYYLYTDNPEKAIEDLKVDAAEFGHVFIFSAVNESQEQLEEFEEAHQENVISRNLLVLAGVLITLFVIYFTIKSNVSSRTEELTVYRLLGIAKESIVQAYLLEMFLVTSYTVLPAVLITSGVIKFIGSIPSLELGLAFPWWTAGLLIVIMYLLNLIISVLPVRGILAKPPAVLAAKQ